jgi:type I restriction enzyme M protein
VECVYQGSKVFANGGPYTDLYEKSAKAAKKDERLKNSGELIAFEFEGVRYPIRPRTIFYDYIYINALRENPEQANALMKFDGFTDIEFNPKTGVSCQARAAARFVSLSRMGLLNGVEDFAVFRGLIDLRHAA